MPKRASTASAGSAATSPKVRSLAQPNEQARELLVVEHGDRPRRAERGRRTGIDHERGAGSGPTRREPGRETAVGDAHPYVTGPGV